MTGFCIVWFRRDLRVTANPALEAALSSGYKILPVYIEDEAELAKPALNVFKHYALANLTRSLAEIGLKFNLYKGDSASIIKQLALGAKAIYWNRVYEPDAILRDTKLKSELNIEVKSFNGSLLLEPWQILNKQGEPFKVFTAYYRRHAELMHDLEPQLSSGMVDCFAALASANAPCNAAAPKSLDLQELNLLPESPGLASSKYTWHHSIENYWQLKQAPQALTELLADFDPSAYPDLRNRPDLDGVSKLSPYLALGVVSPQMIYAHLLQRGKLSAGAREYIRQLGWRDYAYHLIYHMPELASSPQRKEFNKFPWQINPEILAAWQQGRTGYPIVDAGMRQLWQTGWMHNRVRMIVASFLVKDLFIDWREGAKWFMHTLVDADLANNTMGWQWCAGCGVDAAPYFRIFNPSTQAEKFDPDASYIRRYLPELARLPQQYIYQPWLAPQTILEQAGLELGRDYPYPLVDHASARLRALEIYKSLR